MICLVYYALICVAVRDICRRLVISTNLLFIGYFLCKGEVARVTFIYLKVFICSKPVLTCEQRRNVCAVTKWTIFMDNITHGLLPVVLIWAVLPLICYKNIPFNDISRLFFKLFLIKRVKIAFFNICGVVILLPL